MTRGRLWLGAFVAALLLLPFVIAGRLSLSIFLFIGLNALIVVGLTLLGGHAGQISLGQAGFYGIGAYVAAITSLRGLDPWLGMALAPIGAAAIAYLVGAPILLLRGHYLVLGTLGLNIIVDVLVRNFQGITGGPSGLTGIPPLALGAYVLEGDRVFYYLTWAATLAALWLGRNLIRSRVGRALAAVRASEVAAATLGIDPAFYKSRVFALSAAFAGLAGGLYVHYLSFVSPSPFAFEFSIVLLVMSVLGGIAYLPGAVLGAAVLTLLREALRTALPRVFGTGASAEYEIIVFGVLLAVVVIFAPDGLWPHVARWLRLDARGPLPPPARAPSEPPAPVAIEDGGAPLLVASHLTKRFGGLVAVDDLSFAVRRGEIYAIIGPNGAGKTTLFNLISGVLRPARGAVAVDGRTMTGLRAYEIAAAGIARTFQTPYIFGALTVAENVMLGMHRRLGATFTTSMLDLARREEAAARAAALAELDRVGLRDAADLPASALSFGASRLLEMARALATRPRLLLLDEPASGLSAAERAGLVALIRRIRDDGVTIVLVEHDVGLVMGLADRILVLNYGRRIAEDTPATVRADPRVVAAYLGEPA